MINSIIRYSLIFIALILLQLLLFNNIQVSGYINPYIYIMAILILPATLPQWLILIISFLTGFIIDLFSGSLGMHSAATLLAGFVRPYVLTLISPRDGYEQDSDLSMGIYGVRWFFIYASIIVVIHHLALFYLEVFRLTDFFRTMLRVILSSAISITFIMLIGYYRKGRRRAGSRA
jgi:rod shape-determining protein MreD